MRRPLAAAFVGGAALIMGSVALAGDLTYVAHLKGRHEVPATGSTAVGNAVFHLSQDGAALEYRLIVADIHNVVAAHIHIGATGVNGAVVAFLFGPAAPAGGRESGVLATGTITADELVGPLAGHALADLVAAIEAGNAYVNVHTNDGEAPINEGPGDFPGGEIRAQMS